MCFGKVTRLLVSGPSPYPGAARAASTLDSVSRNHMPGKSGAVIPDKLCNAGQTGARLPFASYLAMEVCCAGIAFPGGPFLESPAAAGLLGEGFSRMPQDDR